MNNILKNILNTINQVLVTAMYTLIIITLVDILVHPTLLDDIHTHIHLSKDHTQYIHETSE
jgi:hypothetical protein